MIEGICIVVYVWVGVMVGAGCAKIARSCDPIDDLQTGMIFMYTATIWPLIVTAVTFYGLFRAFGWIIRRYI